MFYLTFFLAFSLASSLTFFLTFFLAFCLTYVLTFYLTYLWHSVWHFVWHSGWHCIWHLFWFSFSDIDPGICSAILSSCTYFGILSDILSDILSGSLSDICSDILFVWHSLWFFLKFDQPQSFRATCSVRVQAQPIASEARWLHGVRAQVQPTASRARYRRSGPSAHCIWSSRYGLGSLGAHSCDELHEEETRSRRWRKSWHKKKRRRGCTCCTVVIKSGGPHLAGGKKCNLEAHGGLASSHWYCARTTMLHALTLTKHGKLPVVAALSPSAAPRSRWPPCVYVRFAGAWQTTCIWQRGPKDWAPLPPVWSRPPLPSVAAAGIQDIFSFGFRRAFLCLSEFSSDSEGSTVSRDLLLLTDVRGRRCLLLFPSRRLRLGDFAATRWARGPFFSLLLVLQLSSGLFAFGPFQVFAGGRAWPHVCVGRRIRRLRLSRFSRVHVGLCSPLPASWVLFGGRFFGAFFVPFPF